MQGDTYQREQEQRELQGRDPAAYYEHRKTFYQDPAIAQGYDAHRFTGARARRNRAKWKAITKALAIAGDVREVLDLPTGTGRFVEAFAAAGYGLVGSDISREMMTVAKQKAAGLKLPPHGFVQADVEHLPFRDNAFDACCTIRFLFHLTPDVRVNALRELGRVSKRWVIADFRHRYTIRHVLGRLAHAVGLKGPPQPRVSRQQVEDELAAAGLRRVTTIAIAPLFSDKWVVLCEKVQTSTAVR